MIEPTDNLFQSEFAVMEDCKMISRAARLGWPISAEKRAELIERLFKITASAEARDAVSAAKAILAADTINQRREAARDARRAAKKGGGGVTINNINTTNTAVQINADPTSNAERFEQAMALLEAARTRAISAVDGAPADEILREAAVPPAIEVPGAGLP